MVWTRRDNIRSQRDFDRRRAMEDVPARTYYTQRLRFSADDPLPLRAHPLWQKAHLLPEQKLNFERVIDTIPIWEVARDRGQEAYALILLLSSIRDVEEEIGLPFGIRGRQYGLILHPDLAWPCVCGESGQIALGLLQDLDRGLDPIDGRRILPERPVDPRDVEALAGLEP